MGNIKKYSFDKNKIVDVKAVEKTEKKKGLTFSERLKKFGNKTGEIAKQIDENNKKRKEKQLINLKKEAEKTKVIANIEKNKASIRKSKNAGRKTKDKEEFDFNLGFKF